MHAVRCDAWSFQGGGAHWTTEFAAPHAWPCSWPSAWRSPTLHSSSSIDSGAGLTSPHPSIPRLFSNTIAPRIQCPIRPIHSQPIGPDIGNIGHDNAPNRAMDGPSLQPSGVHQPFTPAERIRQLGTIDKVRIPPSCNLSTKSSHQTGHPLHPSPPLLRPSRPRHPPGQLSPPHHHTRQRCSPARRRHRPH